MVVVVYQRYKHYFRDGSSKHIYEIGDVQRKKDTRPSEATLTQFL